MSNLRAGTTVEDRYVLLKAIGEGGMGSVFTAGEIGLQRVVAIKFLLDHNVGNPKSQARFKREAKILSQLAHPNIVTFYRLGLHNGILPYIAMEHVQGTSLDTLLLSHTIFPVDRCLHIAMQICDALEAAHSRGILHRDLKPGNIVVLDLDLRKSRHGDLS